MGGKYWINLFGVWSLISYLKYLKYGDCLKNVKNDFKNLIFIKFLKYIYNKIIYV